MKGYNILQRTGIIGSNPIVCGLISLFGVLRETIASGSIPERGQ